MRKVLLLITMVVLSCTHSVALSAQDGSISGTVRDLYGAPVPGAQIEIPELRVVSTTDAGGEFTIRNIPFGEYTVVVRSIGRSSLSRAVRIAPSQTSELTFVLGGLDNPKVEVRLEGSAGARVQVDGKHYGSAPGLFVVKKGSRKFYVYHPEAPGWSCKWTAKDLLPGDSRCYVCTLMTKKHRLC